MLFETPAADQVLSAIASDVDPIRGTPELAPDAWLI